MTIRFASEYYCEECDSTNLDVVHSQMIFCNDCGLQQSFNCLTMADEETTFKNKCQRKKRAKSVKVKSNYVRRGVMAQLQTEYSNKILPLCAEGVRSEILALLQRIVVDNERLMSFCHQLFAGLFNTAVKPRAFKRNTFIEQNCVAFFLLFRFRQDAGLDALTATLKHNTNKKLKALWEAQKKKGEEKLWDLGAYQIPKLAYLFENY